MNTRCQVGQQAKCEARDAEQSAYLNYDRKQFELELRDILQLMNEAFMLSQGGHSEMHDKTNKARVTLGQLIDKVAVRLFIVAFSNLEGNQLWVKVQARDEIDAKDKARAMVGRGFVEFRVVKS